MSTALQIVQSTASLLDYTRREYYMIYEKDMTLALEPMLQFPFLELLKEVDYGTISRDMANFDPIKAFFPDNQDLGYLSPDVVAISLAVYMHKREEYDAKNFDYDDGDFNEIFAEVQAILYERMEDCVMSTEAFAEEVKYSMVNGFYDNIEDAMSDVISSYQEFYDGGTSELIRSSYEYMQLTLFDPDADPGVEGGVFWQTINGAQTNLICVQR